MGSLEPLDVELVDLGEVKDAEELALESMVDGPVGRLRLVHQVNAEGGSTVLIEEVEDTEESGPVVIELVRLEFDRTQTAVHAVWLDARTEAASGFDPIELGM